MQFYLVYRGPLSSTQRKKGTTRDERINIRKQVTPQLKRLWETHRALTRLQWDARIPGEKMSGDFFTVIDSPLDPIYDEPPKHPPREGFVDLTAPIEVKGKQFRPIVRQNLDLTCSLDILFLRQDDPGRIRDHNGDLDNRIKTFIDALEMPQHELDGDEIDGVNYCLLENDFLVRSISVDSERLLLPDSEYPNEVHLVVEVSVRVERVGPWNVALI